MQVIFIQQYSLKRGFSRDIARIRSVLEKNFPAEIKENNGKCTISYGAFAALTVWLDKNMLCIDTESNKTPGDAIILETNKRFRVFLEEATGYNAKERVAKAKKEAGE